MTARTDDEADDELWQAVIDAEREAEQRLRHARQAFVVGCRDRSRVLRTALLSGYRATALVLLPHLPEQDQIAVFPILVELAATGHSSIGLVRRAILAMPRQWVLDHIEQYAERHMATIGAEAYRRYAELFAKLDSRLLARLVERALESPNPDVREVGEDFSDREWLARNELLSH